MFVDLEGDAFAADGGIEYLFGVADHDGNYNASWALDPASEKHTFERFIDNVMARWEQHPGFHIYHYGAYETTAVKRLMSRYATREDEVDRLLRGRMFVDLHRVVRQGLRASVESYSIKKLEPFYGFARAVDLTTATRALIQVEVRLESGDAAGVPEPLRTEIEGYTRGRRRRRSGTGRARRRWRHAIARSGMSIRPRAPGSRPRRAQTRVWAADPAHGERGQGRRAVRATPPGPLCGSGTLAGLCPAR